MAVSFDSLATAKSKVLGYFRTQLGDWGLGPKDFFGKLAAVLTLVLYGFLRTARLIDNDAVPTTNTSSAGLDQWATFGTGIPNGAGSQGRLFATVGTGGVAPFTGTPGTVYPALSTLTASDGVTKFQLTNGPLTVPGGGSINGNINATTAGTGGNLAAGAVLTVDSIPIGGVGTVTLGTGVSGGTNTETDANVLARIQARLNSPPKGGVAHDYRTWLENAYNAAGLSLAIARAYIYPLRNGVGSVDAVITQSGSSTGSTSSRAPSSGTQSSAQTYLDGQRPITVNGDRVLLPTIGSGLNLICRPQPTLPANAFQFDSTTGGPFTAAAGSTSTSLVLNANCVDLNTQLNVNLKTVLLQIVSSTGAYALPQVVTVTAYNAGTFTATVTPALSPAPSIGDKVFAGAPMVLPIATALLGLVDALGPSRAGGYADPLDPWQDTLEINQMIRTALNVTDASGVPYAVDLAATPTINGVATNKQGADTGASPPELLFVASIAVTP